MAKHGASDSTHDQSRTYPASKTEAARNRDAERLIREGKIKPGELPRDERTGE